MRKNGQVHAERTPGAHWIGGWVGPTAGAEKNKTQPLPGIEPRSSISQLTTLTELPRLLILLSLCVKFIICLGIR